MSSALRFYLKSLQIFVKAPQISLVISLCALIPMAYNFSFWY